jgi:hypothetical protein
MCRPIRARTAARQSNSDDTTTSPARRQAALLAQETWGYSCLHPADSRVVVRIAFSERGLAGKADPSLTETREHFFSGLRVPKAAAR